MAEALVDRLKTALGGRYAIERELGAGGMATVYLAQDVKHGRQVAVKVLRPDLSAVVGAERFLQEIRITAQLDHPHILTLIDSGESDSLVWYVVPYIRGESLRQKLEREKQLRLEEALAITRQVASALDFAHRKGVIHRDLKPDNILLFEGEAMLADFGIALAVKEAGGHRLTETGISLGTPQYMSPEQATGDHLLDARTDVYSLGAVAYEMLAGEPPYSGPTVQAVISKCLLDPVPHVRRVRAAVPDYIERAVRKALAKTPADRFTTAAEFAEALSPSTSQTAPQVKSIAVLPFANLSADPDNEYFSDGMTEDIINALTKLPELRVASRTSAFAFKKKELDIRHIGDQLNVDTVLEGSVRKVGNRLRITAQLITVADGYHLWSERYDREMEDVFAVQDEIARAIVEALRIQVIGRKETALVRRHTDDLEAYSLYLKGRHFWNRRGEALFKAVEYFTKAVERDPRYAPAYAGLADSYSVLAWWEFLPPKQAFPKALAAATKALELDESLSEAHTSLAFIRFFYDWAWADAEREFTRAAQLNPGYATMHHWFAEYLMAMGRSQEAVTQAKRAQELDPLGLIVNTVVGMAFYYSRDYDRSIYECQRTIEMDPAFTPPYLWLALSNLQKGMYDEAIGLLQQATSLSGSGGSMRAILGCAYGMSGREREAEQVLEDLSAMSNKSYVSPFSMAVVQRGLGRTDAVFRSLERAFEERTHLLVFLRVDPLLDALRSDSRFAAMLARVGLV